MPPDECIEMALWERFQWGPNETDQFTSKRLRALFLIIEQERISRNAVEVLGKPDNERFANKQREEAQKFLSQVKKGE